MSCSRARSTEIPGKRAYELENQLLSSPSLKEQEGKGGWIHPLNLEIVEKNFSSCDSVVAGSVVRG